MQPNIAAQRTPPPRRGSLCGNGWWVRVIFGEWCRFAQDDTGVTGARDEKQNAVFVRTVKHRIIPVNCTIFPTKQIPYHAPVPYVSF